MIHKEHKEFYKVDLDGGWEVLPGYPSGIEQQILSGSLNEKEKTGFRTRHLRFKPGVYTTAPFVHEYWEEVYLVSGDLMSGTMPTETARNSVRTPRLPATWHISRSFKSQTGCLLLELHYYDEQ